MELTVSHLDENSTATNVCLSSISKSIEVILQRFIVCIWVVRNFNPGVNTDIT